MEHETPPNLESWAQEAAQEATPWIRAAVLRAVRAALLRHHHRHLWEITSLTLARDQALARCDGLRQQARGWAQEARIHRATVREVGQVLGQAQDPPRGSIPTWGPIVRELVALVADRDRLRADLARFGPRPTWEGGLLDELERLRREVAAHEEDRHR